MHLQPLLATIAISLCIEYQNSEQLRQRSSRMLPHNEKKKAKHTKRTYWRLKRTMVSNGIDRSQKKKEKRRRQQMFVPFFSQHIFVQMSKPEVNNCRHSQNSHIPIRRNGATQFCFSRNCCARIDCWSLAHAYSVLSIRSLAQQNEKEKKKKQCGVNLNMSAGYFCFLFARTIERIASNFI